MRKILQYIRPALIILIIQSISYEVETVYLDTSNHVTLGYVFGVVDRMEDNGAAVILVEELNREFIIYPDYSHDVKLQPNMWLYLLLRNDKIIDLSVAVEKTNREMEKVVEIEKKLRKEQQNHPISRD